MTARAAAALGAALAVAGLGGRAATARAQAPRHTSPQLVMRADAMLFRRSVAAQLGAGANVAIGNYVRLGLTGALGATTRRAPRGGSSETGVSGRADLLARFLLDPFREFRWAGYAGGGASLRWELADHRPRAFLLLAVGVEGPPAHGVLPSLELGLGGGYRVGLVLRRARAELR